MKNKRTIIILIAICIVQSVVIYFCFDSFGDKVIGNFLLKFEKKESKECFESLTSLLKKHENNDFDSVFKLGESLLRSSFYSRDKIVLHTTADANYVKGNKARAIELLSASLHGNYVCHALRPNDIMIYLEDAIVHYRISIIHYEKGRLKEAETEKEMAYTTAKLFYEMRGMSFDEKIFKKIAAFPGSKD